MKYFNRETSLRYTLGIIKTIIMIGRDRHRSLSILDVIRRSRITKRNNVVSVDLYMPNDEPYLRREPLPAYCAGFSDKFSIRTSSHEVSSCPKIKSEDLRQQLLRFKVNHEFSLRSRPFNCRYLLDKILPAFYRIVLESLHRSKRSFW